MRRELQALDISGFHKFSSKFESIMDFSRVVAALWILTSVTSW